ncbi:ArsR family transcriptional regulator [archaeon]|nr:ArsR family transcriptional regulator [archaeon]
MAGFRKLTIIRLKGFDEAKDINKALQWLSLSLGLFSTRDKRSSCYRLFIELMKSARQKRALTSDELAYKVGLSRGTVVHHLRKLIAAGIVEHRGNRYMLSSGNLKGAIRELRKDVEKVLNEMEDLAKGIDKAIPIKPS